MRTHLASWSLDSGDTFALACKTAKDCKLGGFASFYLQIVLEEGIWKSGLYPGTRPELIDNTEVLDCVVCVV